MENRPYPEFLIERPTSPNWVWTWSVYDPPTQGEYYGGTAYSYQQAKSSVEYAITHVLTLHNRDD